MGLGLAKITIALIIWLSINLLFLGMWRNMPRRARIILLLASLLVVATGLAIDVYHQTKKQAEVSYLHIR